MKTNILNCITIAEKHTDLVRFPKQFVNMVTDGQWAIDRGALMSQYGDMKNKKAPKFMQMAFLTPIDNNLTTSLDELCKFDGSKAVAIDIEPVLYPLDTKRGTLSVMFKQVDGELVSYANAHLVKLLSEIFPGANWFATAPLKPLMLVCNGVLLAILMPIQKKGMEIVDSRKAA